MLAAFIVLAVLVALGALTRLDRTILDVVQLPHASWLDLAASAISVFGQSEIIGSIALGVAVVRLRAGRRDWWTPLLVALVVVVELVLKLAIPQAPPPSELARSVRQREGGVRGAEVEADGAVGGHRVAVRG